MTCEKDNFNLNGNNYLTKHNHLVLLSMLKAKNNTPKGNHRKPLQF